MGCRASHVALHVSLLLLAALDDLAGRVSVPGDPRGPSLEQAEGRVTAEERALIQEAEQVSEAANDGPWEVGLNFYAEMIPAVHGPGGSLIAEAGMLDAEKKIDATLRPMDNAVFIAAARRLVPLLAAALEARLPSDLDTLPTNMGWHVISGEHLLELLRRARAGEEPSLIYAEAYANAEHKDIDG